MKKNLKTSYKLVCFLLIGLLSSCKPSNEKMIIGIWANDYPYSSNAMFEWMEFKKEGYTVDENGFSFSYSVHDNHILFKDEALEIVKLDKDVLILKSEKNGLWPFHKVNEIQEPLINSMPPITVNHEETDTCTLSLEEMERISNETEDIEEYEIP